MRLFLLFLALIVIYCGVFAAGLVVPPGGIALGEVQPGAAVAAEVVVSNDAERTISVSRVKACCGGVAELVPMSVPAKGEAKLTLRMKAQIPGEIAKAVTLYCDDPHQPIVEIPVTGKVVETAEVKMMAGGTVAAIIAALSRLNTKGKKRPSGGTEVGWGKELMLFQPLQCPLFNLLAFSFATSIRRRAVPPRQMGLTSLSSIRFQGDGCGKR